MRKKAIKVGIAYNAYEPVCSKSKERLSEESVEQMAHEVGDAVTALGYSAIFFPLKKSFMGFLKRLSQFKVDVIVNLCEGFCGRPQYEANVAGVFELVRIPFTGNTSKTLGLCQNKNRTKAILKSFGLPTAKSKLMTSADYVLNLAFPLIVKPNSEDASLGIYPKSVVFDQKNLSRQIKKILRKYKQPALVEEYIEGREFNISLLDGDRMEALPVSEIDFSRLPEGMPRICSYEAKWFEDHILFNSTPPICPAPISSSLRSKLQQTALAAAKVMGCRDYSRVDLRMDENGRLYVLEVNPNPDISLNAGYARALAAAGIGYKDFWKRMIENALRRKERI